MPHCADIADVKDDVLRMLMRVKYKAYYIINYIVASRYVANMETFVFVPTERGGQ